ncbi:imidazolonepropionase-like amidohydrolase [Micromonospora sp. Llam0]|uniref:metal-dependent hydrolase family protein n=1 Tax=Micromonospora sp. Llam0 TaxID=2485143 RepID=UPI000FA74333|nr:amidohydrolase family protein [Micromonospora sp. Llam0]ROO58726.1 imidazolonepropionase-like amidohydrolase [Micromonospora sp. Llam0]
MGLHDGAALRVHNVRLIDGISPRAVDDAVLEAGDDGRITYAGPAAGAPAARPGVRSVDGRGGTLLPGLFDCHTHLGIASDRSLVDVAMLTDPVLGVLRTSERLRRTLDAGITSARDLGGLPAGFRDAVAAGLIAGPRLQTSVGVISHTGGHADGTLPSGRDLALDYCEIADDVTGVRKAARRVLRAGADLIKICTSGGMSSAHDDPDDQDLLDEEIAAAVDEGRRHRERPVAAHAQGRAGVLAAIRGGVRSVEHGYGIDDEGCDLLGEHGAFLVPTLSTVFQPLDPGRTVPWRYQKKLRWNEQTKANIAQAIARKVTIAAGTDAGISPHGQNPFELWCLVQLGMSPMDAIRSATSTSAQLLGVGDSLGALRPGYVADLVLCTQDPLREIACLSTPENIALVAQQGVIRKITLSDHSVSEERTTPGPRSETTEET